MTPKKVTAIYRPIVFSSNVWLGWKVHFNSGLLIKPNLTHQKGFFAYTWDIFLMSIWERAHRQSLERAGPFRNNLKSDWTNFLSVTLWTGQSFFFTTSGASRKQCRYTGCQRGAICRVCQILSTSDQTVNITAQFTACLQAAAAWGWSCRLFLYEGCWLVRSFCDQWKTV